MPSPAVIQPEASSRPVAPVSRLTLGAPPSGSIPRKKPQSATVDGRSWAEAGPEHFPAPRSRDALQTFAQAVLPGALVRGQRRRLAGNVLADFLLLILNFAVVSHLGVLLEFSIRRDPAVLLQPLIFPVSGLGLLLLYGTLLTLLGHSEGLYRTDLVRAPREERLILCRALGWATLLVGAAIYQSDLHAISLAVLVACAPLNYLGMLGWREWVRRVASRRTGRGYAARNVLIVGAGKLGREVAAYLEGDHGRGRVVLGFLDETGPIGGDVHGRVEDLARIARAKFADEIIFTLPRQPDLARWVVQEARRNRLDVRVVPDLLGFEPHGVALDNFGDVPVLTLHEEPIPALGLFLKRAVDVAGSATALLITLPVLAAIALVIKLDSPGPVLYRGPRVGKKGRNFACYKFRTMVADADKSKAQLRACNQRQGPFFKIVDDPRITRVGRCLRRYSLDELPQLWNVLEGEMSLVGPRPHPLDDFEHYDLEDLRRLDVTPGITGLWQVTARRDPSFRRNMALDLEYIERWDLWMDLRILYKTVFVVLQGSGA